MDEFGSKQGHNEAGEMSVELLCNIFVKPMEVGQSQDEDLLGVPPCPVIYILENRLSQGQDGGSNEEPFSTVLVFI